MQLLLLSLFIICVTFITDAKHPNPPKTLRHSPVEGENQIFGRSLMKGVLSPSNDVVGQKIKNRKKRHGLRKVVVVPPKNTSQKK
jgi:hypothetical protein